MLEDCCQSNHWLSGGPCQQRGGVADQVIGTTGGQLSGEIQAGPGLFEDNLETDIPVETLLGLRNNRRTGTGAAT